MTKRLVALVPVVTVLWLLGGCSAAKDTYRQYVPEKDKVDYKRAKTINELEVPPDLTSESIDAGMVVPDVEPTPTATYSDYTRERQDLRPVREAGVLPQQEKIRVARDEDTYWLVVAEPPDEVWPTMRDFWLQSGFLIKKQDARIGILETDWAENRADIPQDIIRRTIGKVLDPIYSAATRDKFRVRLERGREPGTTEIYLTHYGAEEVIEGTTSENVVWRPRPADPELEVEMLRRMAVYMGAEDERARAMVAKAAAPEVVRARLTQTDTGTALRLDDEFARAWRRTGVALDRIGFTVEDRDRSKGVYYVRYVDLGEAAEQQEGFLDRFKFWGGDDEGKTKRYQVSLNEAQPSGTQVTVLNEQGAPEQSQTAYRILSLLEEQLK